MTLDLNNLEKVMNRDGCRYEMKTIVDESVDMSDCFDPENFLGLRDIQLNIIMRPDEESKIKFCFDNVKNYVERNPGAIPCYGWIFMEFELYGFDSFLPHAIVKENDEFIDITPRMITVNHQYPFLLDPQLDLQIVKRFLYEDGFNLGISREKGNKILFRIKFIPIMPL